MLKILRFTVEHLSEGCVTDCAHPRFSFCADSSHQQVSLRRAVICVGAWRKDTTSQIQVTYDGPPLEPFRTYQAHLQVFDTAGETAEASLCFSTGRLDTPWSASWITDPLYRLKQKAVSPIPMTFRRIFSCSKPIAEAKIYATAMGIYTLSCNDRPVDERYFAPGFTSYAHNLAYQVYDVTGLVKQENTLEVTVAGGWAVGSFGIVRRNKIRADRQALLLELRLQYKDGSCCLIGTDGSWEVTTDGPCRYADIYDGEVYDARIRPQDRRWHPAAPEKLRHQPQIFADRGCPVRLQEAFEPVSCQHCGDSLVYDFGQNFAGVVQLQLRGKAGQTVTVNHSEILNPDGTLNTRFLRTAKAELRYTCRDGLQVYCPRFTYMGFRYIAVRGIACEDITVTARALYSQIPQIGSFACSDPLLNRLQQNILWSAKSNFVDIPTDCPQRDERMGWTGDIGIFAPTACFNFDMSRFLEKWLQDLRCEQSPTGGIPNTVPSHGYGFPETMPLMAVDWWDDACVLVPWTLYRTCANEQILRLSYDSMKRYVKACAFWARLFSVGKHRCIWHTPAFLHFGDWVAPDLPMMQQWQKRSKWTATASLRNTSRLTGKVAALLGRPQEASQLEAFSQRVADAFSSILTDGDGQLHEEFQTAYVLGLELELFSPAAQPKAAARLARLVESGDYCIGTGFPGTPYILFALADHGYADTAFRMLMNQRCPSWLYEVTCGATTVWERWDGLDRQGQCPIGKDGTGTMISYNHYASGAVGDFLYRRIAGIEALEPGYRRFQIRPLVGGGLTWAEGTHLSPYGLIRSHWQLEDGFFTLCIQVPVGTTCEIILPSGSSSTCGSGHYRFSEPYPPAAANSIHPSES